MEEARGTWRKYGKGNHPAGLNFCDCCACALAKLSGDTLLFKGNDFSRTDIVAAIEESAALSFRTLRIELRKTYYRQGFFNIRVEHSRLFGAQGEAIEIYCAGRRAPVIGTINRTAQQNGTPRIMGHAALRDYFHTHFKAGDQLVLRIESPRRARLERYVPSRETF
jgi:hypothetical protein